MSEELIKVDFLRTLELIEFEFTCKECGKRVQAGLTSEDISVGDISIFCSDCEETYYVDLKDLLRQVREGGGD